MSEERIKPIEAVEAITWWLSLHESSGALAVLGPMSVRAGDVKAIGTSHGELVVDIGHTTLVMPIGESRWLVERHRQSQGWAQMRKAAL